VVIVVIVVIVVVVMVVLVVVVVVVVTSKSPPRHFGTYCPMLPARPSARTLNCMIVMCGRPSAAASVAACGLLQSTNSRGISGCSSGPFTVTVGAAPGSCCCCCCCCEGSGGSGCEGCESGGDGSTDGGSGEDARVAGKQYLWQTGGGSVSSKL